jgi:hypothetical protein
MTTGPPRGARLAQWWVAAYTATAPEAARQDRRAELAADLADQERAAGRPDAALSRRIAGRAARGVTADLMWRLAVECVPGRGAWHLAHPATVLGAVTAVLVPLNLVDDRLGVLGNGWLGAGSGVLHGAVLLLSAVVAGFAVTAALRQLGGRRRALRPASTAALLLRLRHRSWVVGCVAWALSELWRFAPAPLGRLSDGAWVLVGLSLLTWGVAAAGVLALERPRRRWGGWR